MCQFNKIIDHHMIWLEEVHQVSSSDSCRHEKMSPVTQHQHRPLIPGQHQVTPGSHGIFLLQGCRPDQRILGSSNPVTRAVNILT